MSQTSQPNIFPSSVVPSEKTKKSSKLSHYEYNVANKFGYCGITLNRFREHASTHFKIVPTSVFAQILFWGFCTNTCIKTTFLCFLVNGYFGPLQFFDKIAALDYFLCGGMVFVGLKTWGLRYPFHEILHQIWTIENTIFGNLGYPNYLKKKVEYCHKSTVRMLLVFASISCTCLARQFYADPKYRLNTYSAFEWDTRWLQILFCLHECIFMAHAWTLSISFHVLCTFETVVLANLFEEMTSAVNSIHQKLTNSEDQLYSLNKLILNYKQITIATDRLNDWIAYNVLLFNLLCFCQLLSDVYVAIHILRAGGSFEDIWFFLEDCSAGLFIMHRTYCFMSRVPGQSENFLLSLGEHLKYCSSVKRKILSRTLKPLKIVTLRVGPIVIDPNTVMSAMDTFGQYYVCVALW